MINKDKALTMQKICRSCMCEGKEMRNLFETKESEEGQTLKLAEMLMACASIRITTDDGLPVQLCLTCENKLDTAFEFKQQCEKTDSSLRELTNQPAPKRSIKQESLDIVIQPDLSIPEFYNDVVADSDTSETSNEKQLLSLQISSDFTCSYCHKILRTKKGLKIHQRRHTGDKMRSCHLCQAKFTRTNHLRRHIENHTKPGEDTERSHICIECGASFGKANHLTKHKKEHKLEVDIKKESEEINNADDEDQNETYDESEDEIAEENSKENSEQQTYRRGKRKKRITYILDDKQVEKGEKEKRVMQCEFCDREFKYRKSFLHHMQTEHGMSDESDVPLSTYVTKKESGDENIENSEFFGESDPNEINVVTSVENADEGIQEYNETILPLTSLESKKLHSCHVCDSKFARANHLTRHMTLHRAVLTHKCDRCDKAYATAEHLTKHNQEDHIDKPYVCTKCDRPFSRGEHLIRHLKIHSTKDQDEDENLTCSICEKVFSRSDHLARHTKVHLQQDKRHICTECGKAFNRLDNLKTHQRIHSGLKDNSRLHLCIYCGKEFNNSSNMIVHMRRHTGERPYKCTICDKGFPRSHDLKCHERIHSGEKPYLCTLCGKSFNKSNKLLRHTRVHTGERPYVCNLCGRAFTQSNDLALHMRRHTGSRPYACGVCSARFIQSGQLKAHRRSTGHWMETQPDLKGGHRVEPVTPVTNPQPIKFKTHGKFNIKPKEDETIEEVKEPRFLGHTVGIMGNIGIQGDVSEHSQPIIIESTKLLQQFQNAGFVGFTSVINAAQVTNDVCEKFTVTNVRDGTPIESEKIAIVHANDVTFTTVESNSTFGNPERYNYQSYG